MPKTNKLSASILMSPILWGVAATFLFYLPIRSGQLTHPFISRYFDGHWVAYVATGLFLMGFAAIALKALNISGQFQILNSPLLDAIPTGGQPVSMCDALLRRLEAQPESLQQTYLIRRLRESLEYVYRKNTGDEIDDELRSLANLDQSRMRSDYLFLRMLIWTIPVVGLLGAAIGIGEAIAALAPQAIEESLAVVTANAVTGMNALVLALSLTVVLILGKTFVEQLERRLVLAVDERAAAEMVGRFEPSTNTSTSPEITILRRLAEETMKTCDSLVTRQAALWQSSFNEAHKQWSHWSQGATEHMQATLAESIRQTMREHAAAVASAQNAAAEHNAKQWNEVQQALLQNAEAVTLQQREFVRQGELLTQVVTGTSQLEKLENELNRNLSTLAGSHNFEQTVLSLGAAIQLLNSKLGLVPSPTTPQVELKPRRGNKAA